MRAHLALLKLCLERKRKGLFLLQTNSECSQDWHVMQRSFSVCLAPFCGDFISRFFTIGTLENFLWIFLCRTWIPPLMVFPVLLLFCISWLLPPTICLNLWISNWGGDCGRHNLKNVHILIPGTCDCARLHGKAELKLQLKLWLLVSWP